MVYLSHNMENLDRLSCRKTATIEVGGKLVGYEFLIEVDGREYLINAATTAYGDFIAGENQKLPVDMQYDNNYYPLDELSDPDSICKMLPISFEQLKPYLREPDPFYIKAIGIK